MKTNVMEKKFESFEKSINSMVDLISITETGVLYKNHPKKNGRLCKSLHTSSKQSSFG